MHFRDLEPRVIHQTIMRITSSSMIQGVQGPCLKIGVGIDELCGPRLTPLPCMFHKKNCVVSDPIPQEGAKFYKFSRAEGPSGASRPSKTFPEVPWNSVTRQPRIAASHSATRNDQGLGNVGRSRAARCISVHFSI